MQEEKQKNEVVQTDNAAENAVDKSAAILSVEESGSTSKKIGDFFGKIKRGLGKILAKVKGVFAKDKKDEATDTDQNTEEPVEIPEIYLPETTGDLVWLLKKLPEEVLSKKDKKVLASSMSFSGKLVRDVMVPKSDAIFVHENDFMGPLTLDRLYKSGFRHFPVMDTKGGLAGVLHTESLNSLEVRETDRASSYLDPTVYYMRDTYTMEQALAAFIRTNSYFFAVVNQGAQLVGLLTFDRLVTALIGETPVDADEFDADKDLMAVAKRGSGLNSYFRKDIDLQSEEALPNLAAPGATLETDAQETGV